MTQIELTRLAGYGKKSMQPIFKIKMLIFQAKTNLDEKIMFGKTTRHLDLEIRPMLVRGMFGNENSASHSRFIAWSSNLLKRWV